MKKKLTLIILSSLVLTGSQMKNKKNHESNPFFQEWKTPYGVPPFDKIKIEHYLPAFEEGIKQQQKEVDAIVNNLEAATFSNTIEAFEYSGALLDKVSSVFFNLSQCCYSPEMEKLTEEILPRISQHSDDINLNQKLFDRISTVYKQKESLNLTAEQMRLLENTYKNFVRNGANIPENQQQRFREINERLSLLTMQFGNNVLKATNNYKLVIDDPSRLEGLPKSQLEAALETGNLEEATKGKYVFTIHLPSMEPFLTNCKDRDLRKELWTAYSTRCTSGATDNRGIINDIVNLRIEQAHILGYNNHAEYILDNCMAKNPKAVEDLLKKVWEPAIQKAQEEAAEYKKMIQAEGHDFNLEPWDWRYYSEQLRKAKFNLNDDSIRPYFSLDHVRNGIFTCCNKLYGITFRENKKIPVYQEDVVAYEVVDQDSVIAIVYLDFFPRHSKFSGAWMTNFREQHITTNGENVIPVVSLVFNFTKPTSNQPSLLNFDETQTFFHEFGHGLHSIFSRCHYQSLAGTNVSRDFVELPSQIFENWACHPEVMRLYAHHYLTGEVIPEEMIKKIETSSTYGQGFSNTELLAASFLDMHFHTLSSPTNIELPEFEDKAMKSIGLIPEIISRYKSTYFQHIFSNGYSAGYYSYTWAAVLDSDAFEPFRTGKIFDKERANDFRKCILSKGNTQDPMRLYIEYRGQEPSIEPLLIKRGLTKK